MRRLTTFLVIALACGALPATGAARAKPHAVVSAVTAQGPAAPGDEVSARVTVGRSGKGKVGSVKLGLALAPGQSPKGGMLLVGKAIAVKLGKARNVKLTLSGVIPATAPVGATRLFACIDVAKAVAKGPARGRCKVARSPLQITTATAGGKIDAAVAAGKLDAATATLYRVYALAGDPRLPAEFRGPLGDASPHGILTAAAESFPALPAAVQRNLFPFFTPPAARGSAWGSPVPKKKKKKKKAKRSQEGPVNCSGFSALEGESDHDGLYAGQWVGIPTSDGNALVHYIKWHSTIPSRDPADVAAYTRISNEMTDIGREPAQRFANAMPEIWQKLTHEFGPPQSDAGVGCYNGGDGRFDVYVDIGGIVRGTNPDASSLTLPYPQVAAFCTNRPSFVLMKQYEDEWTLAHEFMHALQFAHKYKSCGEPIAFWDEGGADWAANFVYPNNKRAQTRAPHNNLLGDPLGYAPGNSSYGWWPFWRMIEKTSGVGVLNSIFSAMENDQAVAAVDNAIPGGFKAQLPAFLIALWNQDPIGKSGFPVSQSFKDWDNWSGVPPVPGKQDLALGGQHEATIKIETDSHSGELPLVLGTIQQVTISDDKVKEIRFKNGGFGHGVHVDAALHMADDTWKLADWSKESTTLCRDNKDEDVRDLIVFSTGVDRSQAFQATHELRGKDECTPPKYRIDEITYSDNLAVTDFAAIGSCHPSTTQTNRTTLGFPGIADDPGGAMSPELPDGHREGLLHAMGTLSKAANFSGCQYNDTATDWVSCGLQLSGEEPYLVEAELKLPAGENDPPAQVTWRPRQPIVGDVNPVISVCVPFSTQPGVVPDPIVTSEPRNKFFDAGQQQISVDAPATVTTTNGTISSLAHYAIKFTRINDDGTPYGG
jgi:hypothetical protein